MSPRSIGALIADYQPFIAELESVIAHDRTCVTLAENRELARVGAHGFAVTGHLTTANSMNDHIAQDWAAHSNP
jgi:hypothetical protein